MGFLDALLGGRRKLKTAAPDRLFAMTTANITMDTGLGLKHRGRAGIVFQPLGTADFQQIVKETEELLAGTAADTGTEVKPHDDEHGYRWLVLTDPDFDDLVVAINTVSSQLESAGYGDRVLAAVFAYEENGKPLYFIYNYKRGAYYPFVPAPGEQARDTERELRLQSQLGAELPWEAGHGPLVPALGHPAVGVFRSMSGFLSLSGGRNVRGRYELVTGGLDHGLRRLSFRLPQLLAGIAHSDRANRAAVRVQ